MTESRQRETGPRAAGRSSGDHQGAGSNTSLAATTDVVADDAAVESYFRNSYAILVRGKTVRRHMYFNLPAAERAVNRARARGDRAEMILVQLVPVRGSR